MRHLFLSSLSCLALLVGCATGDDDDSIQGDDDVTQGDDDDTTAGDDDTTAVDDDDDATPTDDDDATPGDDDDTPADDDDTAGDDDDSANACGTVGQACTDPAQCGSGESCFLGGMRLSHCCHRSIAHACCNSSLSLLSPHHSSTTLRTPLLHASRQGRRLSRALRVQPRVQGSHVLFIGAS